METLPPGFGLLVLGCFILGVGGGCLICLLLLWLRSSTE